jgi:hypothetical protein
MEIGNINLSGVKGSHGLVFHTRIPRNTKKWRTVDRSKLIKASAIHFVTATTQKNNYPLYITA